MSGNQLEYFLLRTLCLKPEEKSVRRLKLSTRKIGVLKIQEPEVRSEKMLILPETSVCYFKGESPSFIHGFSALDAGSDLQNPILETSTEYQIKIVDNGEQRSFQARRIVSVPERNDIKQVNLLVMNLPPDLSPLLAQDCTVSYSLGNSFTYRSADHEIHFVRLDQSIFSTLSNKPMDVLVGVLQHYFSLYNSQQDTQQYDGLSDILAMYLRYFQLDLDLQKKRVCALQYREGPDSQKFHVKSLLESRIEVVEALIEFWDGPLKVITQDHTMHPNELNCLATLRASCSELKLLLKKAEFESIKFEDLFNWRLCNLRQSSMAWWRLRFREHSYEKLQEVALQTKIFVESRFSRSTKVGQVMMREELELGQQLISGIDVWNSQIHLLTLHQPGINPMSSSSSIESKRSKILARPIKPSARITTVSPAVNSFLLPKKERRDKGYLIVSRDGFLLQGKVNSSDWSYQIFASDLIQQTQFADQFESVNPGLWRCNRTLPWPEAPQVGENPPAVWEAYIAEITSDRTFLLCSQSNQLMMLAFHHFSPKETIKVTCMNLPSPLESLSDSAFTDRVQLFYRNYHDSNRSDTFTFIESRKMLLWAFLIIEGHTTQDWFVDLILVLAAFSVSETTVNPRFQFASKPDQQWICMDPGLGGKTELDLRQNINSNFYFSWRQALGRILGVWLRANGGYQIYAMKKDKFILCSQKRACSFQDHFMTELLPAKPGLVGQSPMIFRRNNTLKLLEKGYSFELLELRLEIN